ncbi:carboxylesterase family protein [Sarocladium implicatum]|nr:carboxylesterase family protein [Sarocladium implicatum]
MDRVSPILQTTVGTVHGVSDTRFGSPVYHFRGIPYGSVPKRFAKPEPTDFDGDGDATCFGPQCPQSKVDVGHLLRLPPSIQTPSIEEDEFRCLNLNVSCPAPTESIYENLLPVLVWIHGGSQCVTFPSAASAVGDPTRLVAESVKTGKPIIVVTFNYRLNIFAFGDGKGERNLALQDQRVAIEWVSKHIQQFGGDPEQITLAGESAGAVYVHAHLLSDPPTRHNRRAVLASGSLHLSPPLPLEIAAGLVGRIEADLATRGEQLSDAPAASLVQALDNCGITSMFLQQTPELEGWETRSEQVDSLLVSDVEYESAIWRGGIQKMTTADIISVVDDCCTDPSKLKDLYHIHPDRQTSCHYGALDLINDTRFALPALEISERWRKDGRNVYQCIIDEANPWQASSRAHHAVDLILLFGGIDTSFNAGAERTGRELRKAWLDFVYGESPWRSSAICAFGPRGRCGEIDEEEYGLRRRVHCFEYLRALGAHKCREISGKLAAGRVSLLN